MRIALVKAPSTYADWYKRPVIGLASISSYIEAHGHQSEIFDAYFHSWSPEELVDRVRKYRPDVIGFTAMTHEIVGVAEIAQKLKQKHGVPAVIGGCHVTALPERTLHEFPVFDAGIVGEGEKTFLEYVQSLDQGSAANLTSIRGLVLRRGESVVVTDPRPFLTGKELDTLPYPAFHHYYGDNPRALAGKGAYYVMFTSRGCPYHCAFCMQVLGRTVRRRSHSSICEEIKFAIQRYGAHTVDFADEIFLFNNKSTYELLQLMIDSGISRQIRWTGLTRANLVDPEIIALAKKAGCVRLAMGVESGDDEILKAIGKGITVAQVREAVRVIKKCGISLSTYFILGHPRETVETVKKTVRLAAELNTDTIAVGIMVPYPGTRIFEMALRNEGGYRLLSQDWSEYDKYGGRALDLDGMPYKELVKWQRRALIYLYVRNLRVLDCLAYLWERRKAVSFLVKRALTGRSKGRKA